MTSIATTLARFAADIRFEDLPPDVVTESKRILLDSLGCALAAVDLDKGRIGIEFAGILGGSDETATIFGSPRRSSIFGAAFANGELINALDFDAILPPGHVSPYVLPGALAVAEADRASGRDLVLAVAIAHEMSNRFGKAMDYIRDVVDGEFRMPPVLGYTSTIFGATAAVTRLRRADADATAHALAIAAAITPVNSHRSWLEHTPVATIKYTMAGPVTQAALTAAHMAFLGHRGDPAVFDDAEFGYRRFIGSGALATRAARRRDRPGLALPARELVQGLSPLPGAPWPHRPARRHPGRERDCDVGDRGRPRLGRGPRRAGLLDHQGDQRSGRRAVQHRPRLAVGAQRLPNSKVWQSPEVVFAPHVLGLMDKVTFHVHPDWASSIVNDPAARPSRVEVDARGRTFTATLRYPKGTPGAAGGVAMSDEELAEKFRLNALGVLDPDVTEEAIELLMNLDAVDDVSAVLRSLGADPAGAR